MYQKLPVPGPWGGIVTAIGRPNAPLTVFDDVVNFFTQKGRIQTRPKLNAFGTAPDGKTILLMRSFRDLNNNFHTLALTSDHAYAVTAGATFNALNFPPGSGITSLGGLSQPFGNITTHRRVYFSNGGDKLMYTDGSVDLKVAGNVPGSSKFLGILADHLIQCYTTEGGTDYPFRVRWSKSTDPNNWSDFSAGSADLMEVADDITGFILSSTNAFVFRSNGITLMVPTGIGTNPFAFENFVMDPKGVGNYYVYTLSSYGGRAILFVAEDDVYRIDGYQPTPVGGAVKKDIFKDISQATGTITGMITPNLGVSYDFLSYWLVIPKASETKVSDPYHRPLLLTAQ